MTLIEHSDFEFVSDPALAHFTVRRIGTKAGRVHDDLGLSDQAEYLIRAKRPGVRQIMERLDYGSVTLDLAAKHSLAKTELVSLNTDWVSRFGYASAGRTARSAIAA